MLRSNILNGVTVELTRLKISSKSTLKRVIVPIFDRYPMLTAKQHDYLFFRDCLMRDITLYKNLPKDVASQHPTAILSSGQDSLAILDR